MRKFLKTILFLCALSSIAYAEDDAMAILNKKRAEIEKAEKAKAKLAKEAEEKARKEAEEQAKLAEKEAQIAEMKSVADWAVLAAVTNADNPLDPTLYARGLELIEEGQVGKTYKPYEIFTVLNPSHTPKYGEGQRVLVQVNQKFTFNGENLAELEGSLSQNGKLAVWKWTEPKPEKPSSELDTQPIQ